MNDIKIGDTYEYIHSSDVACQAVIEGLAGNLIFNNKIYIQDYSHDGTKNITKGDMFQVKAEGEDSSNSTLYLLERLTKDNWLVSLVKLEILAFMSLVKTKNTIQDHQSYFPSPVPTKVISEWPDICPHCASPAYQGLNGWDCSKKCSNKFNKKE
jgi:hypothetical protein